MPRAAAMICCGMDDKAWFVAFAAMRYRREIRGIGFEQQAIGRRDAGGFANFRGFGKSGDTAKSEMEAEIQAFAGCFGVACEAVHDAGQASWFPVCAQDADRVGPGVASMDDDGHSGVGGNFELTDEDGRLRLFRNSPVVIEADLTERLDFRVFSNDLELIEGVGIHFRCIVGMNSGAGIDEWVRIGETDCCFKIGRAVRLCRWRACI